MLSLSRGFAKSQLGVSAASSETISFVPSMAHEARHDGSDNSLTGSIRKLLHEDG